VVRARFFSHTKWATILVPKCTSNGLGQNSARFTWPALQPTAHPASTPASPSPMRPPSALDGRRARRAAAPRAYRQRASLGVSNNQLASLGGVQKPTGQFGCVQNGPPPPLALARPAGRSPPPPSPPPPPSLPAASTAAGPRGVPARRGQNISLVREGWGTPSRSCPTLPDIYLSLPAHGHSPSTGQHRVCPNHPHQLAN
jgi:hypothetical protein